MRKAFVYLQYPKTAIAYHLYKKSEKYSIEDKTIQSLIDMDIERYKPKKILGKKSFIFKYLMLTNKVFRTQFYFRLEQNDKSGSSVARAISKIILKPLDNVQIGKKGFIDGGLFIEHSSGCVISAHRAGKNLTVFQGVTVGDSGKKNSEGFKTLCSVTT